MGVFVELWDDWDGVHYFWDELPPFWEGSVLSVVGYGDAHISNLVGVRLRCFSTYRAVFEVVGESLTAEATGDFAHFSHQWGR